MARKQARPRASQEVVLEPVQITCRACGNRMRMACHSQRTVTTLQGVTHLTLKVEENINGRLTHRFQNHEGDITQHSDTKKYSPYF